ncbi:hypothetical protein B0T19DRAFT_33919 [Cercophora scortea]|uniref:Uncharacterized protein n=1 Tax=Cercophora scortea TaxID=314031 RepID=A0AAE0J3F3_9PEZI|nr:hypothetical protein B0T19DRAFT_33919 [Cercophora scortea]
MYCASAPLHQSCPWKISMSSGDFLPTWYIFTLHQLQCKQHGPQLHLRLIQLSVRTKYQAIAFGATWGGLLLLVMDISNVIVPPFSLVLVPAAAGADSSDMGNGSKTGCCPGTKTRCATRDLVPCVPLGKHTSPSADRSSSILHLSPISISVCGMICRDETD